MKLSKSDLWNREKYTRNFSKLQFQTARVSRYVTIEQS